MNKIKLKKNKFLVGLICFVILNIDIKYFNFFRFISVNNFCEMKIYKVFFRKKIV